MSEADQPVELNVPPLQPALEDGVEAAPQVDLEELAREILMLLKKDLREENDRVGRV